MDQLDLDFARGSFPAFEEASLRGWAFFENAGGSFACRQTIDALADYYRRMKVQPYGAYPASAEAGAAMDRSHDLWSAALNVDRSEVHFGPSTSMNTYILAAAIGATLNPGDEVIVTNQDHEANTGAIRRATTSAGAELVEWRVDPQTGMLDPEQLGAKLSGRTRWVTFPHASNIVGQENDVAHLSAMAHEAGARVIVDGVSFAPHGLPDLQALNPDVYVLSLYKTFSVHQGLMAVRRGVIDELPNQGHYFNAELPGKRLTPAGPDHAQIAAAGGVIEYILASAAAHGISTDDIATATSSVSKLWRDHETALLVDLMARLEAIPGVRILGRTHAEQEGRLHRCPTVAFVPAKLAAAEVASGLAERKVMAGSGHFYARRLIEALGIDPDRGVVRLSFVHYTTPEEIRRVGDALEDLLM